MNKKELSNLLLIFLILTILNFLLWSNARNRKKEGTSSVQTEKSFALPEVNKQKDLKYETASLDTPLLQVIFSNIGGTITSIKLKKYFQPDRKNFVELIPHAEKPTLSFWLKGKENLAGVPFNIQTDPKTLSATLTFSDRTTSITKKFKLYPNSYLIDSEVSGNFDSPEGYFSWEPGLDEKTISQDQPLPPENEALIYKDSLLSRIRNRSSDSVKGINWAGMSNRYFLISLIPQNFTADAFVEKKAPNNYLALVMHTPTKEKNNLLKFKIFAGPKNYDLLKSLGIGLEKTLDLGWKFIEPLSLMVLYILKSSYKYINNYGLLIVLLTILIKVIFHPLSQKSYESTMKIQKLQPEIKKIQEKFKNQPEKIQKELASLYSREKVNPFGGCLPILIQIPIFFALFSTLSNSIELRGSGFVWWINDLSRPDTIATIGRIQINILPILMGISMFIQQKMMPVPVSKENNPSQQMLYIMPVLMILLFWNFPSGLVLYWLTNNIISIWEQFLIIKKKA